jgi:hypothetical protein
MRRGLQRYRCTVCGVLFQSKRRPVRHDSSIWNDYVWGKQNLKQLSTKTGRGVKWVRKRLGAVTVRKKTIVPQPTVFITDTTFFGRTWGVCVFRSPHLKRNVWWTDVSKEVMATYHYGRKILEERGWTFEAVVVDGRRGMLKVFEGMPIQTCQFHQMRTVTKYLTRKPETLEGQTLRSIMLTLTRSTEAEFTKLLAEWKKAYPYILTDKTYVTGTTHWYYTHKKTRGAYLSMERNLPYLFTYLRYPELNIPNTTNSLDGSFTHLKDKVDIHHGLRRDRRYKMIEEILGGEED